MPMLTYTHAWDLARMNGMKFYGSLQASDESEGQSLCLLEFLTFGNASSNALMVKSSVSLTNSVEFLIERFLVELAGRKRFSRAEFQRGNSWKGWNYVGPQVNNLRSMKYV